MWIVYREPSTIMQYLAVHMFLIILPVAISSQCYECVSWNSFEDCDSNRVKVTCPLPFQQCVTAKGMSTSWLKLEAFVKGCAKSCTASGISACNRPNFKCEVKCCSSDYCNYGNLTSTTAPSSPAPSTPVLGRTKTRSTFHLPRSTLGSTSGYTSESKTNRGNSMAAALLPTSASGFLLMGTGVMLVSRF